MLSLMYHTPSKETIVLGNTHFENKPELDHVKYAQAVYYIERIARYLKKHGTSDSFPFTVKELPFISGGDFNSLPHSSVMSVFYNENIERQPQDAIESKRSSKWTIPGNVTNE